VTALWAHDRRADRKVDAMFLNSPFLDLNAPAMVRSVLAPVAVRLGRTRPRADLRLGLNQVYGRSIHRDHDGEWEYDLGWKPLQAFPVRAGWLRAIRLGHARVHNGLDIEAPVLVACSTASYKRPAGARRRGRPTPCSTSTRSRAGRRRSAGTRR
jgi:alpha-beta hydrolase superfamily lysophospholipase